MPFVTLCQVIKGIQQNNVVANAKHYVENNQETNRKPITHYSVIKMACNQHLDSRCVLLSDPSTFVCCPQTLVLAVLTKTRLSRIQHEEVLNHV